MMDKDTDYDDGVGPGRDSQSQKVQVFMFVFVDFEKLEEEDLKVKVTNLGGQIVENNVTWDPRVTHVIAQTFIKSEIVLAGKF